MATGSGGPPDAPAKFRRGHHQGALRRPQARHSELILAPDGGPLPPATPHIDSTLVKAIARAFRWRKMLETGTFGTIEDLAFGEKINPSYVSRILRLTLLAPDIVELMLDRQQLPEMTLSKLMKPFPLMWNEQAPHFAHPRDHDRDNSNLEALHVINRATC